MKKITNAILLTLSPVMIVMILYSCNTSDKRINDQTQSSIRKMDSMEVTTKTEEEWKNILTSDQYHVLREKGTDKPFTGKYYLSKDKGLYVCAACGNELFTSEMKFESACGWPSFDKSVEGGKIKTVTDTSHGMVRTEILCGRCGSHLGHLFDDGPTLSGKRYCVNSTSLNFKGSN